MIGRLKILGKYGLFWLLFFIDARIFFLVYQHKSSFELTFSEWILTFVHGMRLDLSVTGYILLLMGLFFTITVVFNPKYLKYIFTTVTYILLVVFIIVFIADLELYRNWGFRMDTTPLLYLKTPKEALASVTFGRMFFLISLIVIYLSACIYVFRMWIVKDFDKIKAGNWKLIPAFLVITSTMILPIRGGLGIAPMNTGMVYFSSKSFANHAAINVVWNVLFSLTKIKSANKTYDFLEDSEAERMFTNLKKNSEKSIKVLRKNNPNVIILILESFTSAVIKPLGGLDDVTPNLNKYIEEGILFNNFYASGDRSDKGIIAILSGYPAQPTSSIIKFPQKTQKLFYLSKSFNQLGYKTAFYYGGDINFANMRSYLLNSEYDEIISMHNFNKSDYNSKWGAHDHVVLEKMYQDIENEQQSFFKVLFTLSSHEPFEVPMKPVFKGDSEKERYLNSIYYTDSCVGKFIENFKKSNAWENTLIVILADHGNRLPNDVAFNSKEKFQIPMIWLGGAINTKDSIITNYGSQVDIPVTLLKQLDLPASNLKFGKNLLSETPESFAFFVFNDGFGFLSERFETIFDNTSNKFILKRGNYSVKEMNMGKAYLQVLGNDFVNK